jgi:hypothetical protein
LKELDSEGEDGTCEDCDQGIISLQMYKYIIGRVTSGHYADTKKAVYVSRSINEDIVFVIDGSVYTQCQILKDGVFFQKEDNNTSRKMPGFHMSIKNAIKSFSYIFYKFFTKGEFFVDKKTRKKRLDLCRSCDGHYCPKTKKCTICTCPVERKTKFKHSSCPIDKW